ncbi:TPA: hypothetical protein ACH3X1_007003 [Trebouxia sp. C0004]
MFLQPINIQTKRVGLREHPCSTPMRHLKTAEMPCDDRTAALSCAYRLDDVQDSAMNTKFLQHLPQPSTMYNIERFPEVHKAAVQLASFPFLSRLFLFINQ